LVSSGKPSATILFAVIVWIVRQVMVEEVGYATVALAMDAVMAFPFLCFFGLFGDAHDPPRNLVASKQTGVRGATCSNSEKS
jgi:hypothetical protein